MAGERSVGGFGGKLRDARERRGISLRQIANATKISIAALEALERNDISRLPGGIFSRAFVRSYAVEVGLDPEATIQEFIAKFPNDSVTAGHHTSDRVEDHEAVESERRTAGTFLWLALVSVPVAAGLVYFATSGRRPARPESVSTAAPNAPPDRGVESPPPVSSLPPVSSPPAATAPPASAVAPPAIEPPGAAPTSPPSGAPPGAPAAATAGAAPAATGARDDRASDRLAIELTVTRPCYVSATVDGRKQIDRLLQPGERTTIDVRRELVLTAGDASAVALTFNGAEARPLGKDGEVVTARFNLSNFRNYLQPR